MRWHFVCVWSCLTAYLPAFQVDFLLLSRSLNRGRPKGSHRPTYEPNNQKRSNKQCSRKYGIVKKCSELAVITGGTVFFKFTTIEGKSYVYSSCDKLWENYMKEGIHPAGCKEIRMDENAKELSENKEKSKEDRKEKEKEKPAEESVKKSEEKEKEPKVIVIKPDDASSQDEAVSEEKKEQGKPKAKVKIGRPKKDTKKAAPSEPKPKPTQESLTIETQSTGFLNPSLQTLHIDKKFVISSPDVMSENSNSLSFQAPEENSGLSTNDSSSVPIVLFPNQPTFQLDPSLVTNGASSFPIVPVPTSDPKKAPKKRKVRKRSESPENKKKEIVVVKCGVCEELYAKRQDNRRYGRWIGCSGCSVWVHAKCVGWTEADVDSARDYFCKECEEKKVKEAAEKESGEKEDLAEKTTEKGEKDSGKGDGKSPKKTGKGEKRKTGGKVEGKSPKKRKLTGKDAKDLDKCEVSQSHQIVGDSVENTST